MGFSCWYGKFGSACSHSGLILLPSWLTFEVFFPGEQSDLARRLLVVEFDESMRLTLRTFDTGFERITKAFT
jgi:hypothetical protein